MRKFLQTQQTKGYTLLELLVVIAVIAIIATVGIVSYSGTQKKARDAKRRSDLRTISNALEQYYAICGSVYPAPATPTTMYTSIVCASPAQTILATVPRDPNGTAYTCTGCTATGYTISATAWEAEVAPFPTFSNQQ